MHNKNWYTISSSSILTILISLGGTTVLAQSDQDESDEVTEQVVVTGYRQSLLQAIDIKRNSTIVSEAIGADSIGQLPDVTIAESLIRLPGINGTRDRGNQSQAAIRGLGPRLVLGLVNGREVASSEPNRNVRWEIYPSEVVSGVQVYKAQSADLVAGGVAGTVDIQTVKPLDYAGPDVQLRAGLVNYETGDDIPGYDPLGWRGSASWVKDISDEFAINVGLSAQRQKNGFQSFQGWGYNDGTIYPGNLTGDLNGDGTPDPTPWGAQTEVKRLTEDRAGFNVALQWRPSSEFELNYDVLYSKIDIDEDQNQAWYGRNGVMGNWDNGSFGAYNGDGSSYTLLDGDVVAATLNDAYVSVTNVIAQYVEDKELFVTGLNGKYEQGSWTVTTDLSYSQAERTNQWSAVFTEVYPEDFSFDMRAGRRPTASTSAGGEAFNPADPEIQFVPDYVPGQSDGPDELNDELAALALDFEYDLSSTIQSIKFGGRYSDRTKDFLRRQAFFTPLVTNLPVDMISSFELTEFDAPPLLQGDFNELSQIAYGGMTVAGDDIVEGSQWQVDETVLEAFVMATFEKTLSSGKSVFGNFGIRALDVESESWGYVGNDELDQDGNFFLNFEEVTVGNSYSEVLPSINVNLELATDHLLRFGLARVISRPPLDELRASKLLYDLNPPPTGSGGNPLLDPFLANQADASYEWYFADEAMLAIALFYKDVESHIGYTTEPVTINSVTYAVTGPENGDGGKISGTEFTFQTPFYFIGLENFGIYFNYALVDTDVKEFFPPDNPLDVEGYAENSGTLDLWYSNGSLELRLGYTEHSPFTIIGGWDGSAVRTLEEEQIFDFSASYAFTDALTARLQINNLTDEELVIYRDNNPNRLDRYDLYGRRALVDLTYKF